MSEEDSHFLPQFSWGDREVQSYPWASLLGQLRPADDFTKMDSNSALRQTGIGSVAWHDRDLRSLRRIKL